MCIICLNPRASQDEIQIATKQHRREKLEARAMELKAMVRDCRNIIRINEEAGVRDSVSEKLLQKLLRQQHELSREM